MIPPLRHASNIYKLATLASLIIIALTALLAAGVWRSPLEGAGVEPGAAPTTGQGAFGPVTAMAEAAWGVLVAGEAGEAAEGALARRFRLAGTIFGFGMGSAEEPLAILDDKLLVAQRIVRRGAEVLPGVRLTQVRSDAVVLESASGSEELRLDRGGIESGGEERQAGRGGGASAAGGAAAAESRFGGGQVFPGRWEFSRESMVAYYTELREQPERLLSVFDSMEPLYRDNDPSTRDITGYKLNVLGEAEMFEAMGLKQGDVVRSVNSILMTNRRRAEDLIRAFVESEEDTFVFDVERDGNLTKQVYLIK